MFEVVPHWPQVSWRPVCGLGNPLLLGKKRDVDDNDASNVGGTRRTSEVHPLANLINLQAHCGEIVITIAFTETIPSKPVREWGVTSKVPKTTNGIVRSLQLEEKRRKLFSAEREMGRGRPEVHFGQRGSPEEEIVPAEISWRDRASESHRSRVGYSIALLATRLRSDKQTTQVGNGPPEGGHYRREIPAGLKACTTTVFAIATLPAPPIGPVQSKSWLDTPWSTEFVWFLKDR